MINYFMFLWWVGKMALRRWSWVTIDNYTNIYYRYMCIMICTIVMTSLFQLLASTNNCCIYILFIALGIIRSLMYALNCQIRKCDIFIVALIDVKIFILQVENPVGIASIYWPACFMCFLNFQSWCHSRNWQKINSNIYLNLN